MPETEYLIVEHLSLKEVARLFSHIQVDPVSGCWVWTGRCGKGGYGKVTFRGRTELAHRLFFAWLVGPIPRGRHADIPNLDHIVCDNEPCCFPAHMKLGPQRVNILRGNGVSAVNARKTHCAKGHILTLNQSGRRECKICRAQYAKDQLNGPDGEQRRAVARERSRLWMIGYRERKRQENLAVGAGVV